MATFTVNAGRVDPYRNFKFRVTWDGEVVAGVSKVGALERTTEVVSMREGSDPSTAHLMPGTTRFEPIVLERGLTHDTAFEEWAHQVFDPAGDAGTSLANYKKDVAIELLNLQGTVVLRYLVRRCWVSEYQALPELDANGTAVAIERMVLQHEGWERDASVVEPQET